MLLLICYNGCDLDHFGTFGENFDFDTFKNDTFENDTFDILYK